MEENDECYGDTDDESASSLLWTLGRVG